MTLRTLYSQENLPIFQNRMYDSMAEGRNCPKGNMELVEDLKTGLVYNAAFDPDAMDYDGAYQNEQGHSPLFKDHMNSVADLIESYMGKIGLVEVGCGKGTFLEMLLQRGTDVVGYDPTYEGDNPRVRREYFTEDLGITGEGLILRHVLEHIVDPVSFLHRLAKANGNKGLIYIEVPCFDWICDNRAWFDIFYEHVNYFRLTDFNRIFGKVIYSNRAFGGQYLTVIADLSTVQYPVRDPNDAVNFPADMMERLLSEASQDNDRVIVWGGASKGVIFSLLRERMGRPVDRVIDINPSKQGRFLPATGLPVMSPETALKDLPFGTTIYVMNPNYLEEIRRMAPNYHVKNASAPSERVS